MTAVQKSYHSGPTSLKSRENQTSKERAPFANLERAFKVFEEIENIIEQELADAPLLSVGRNLAHVKRKRGGPTLIKPLNKKKNRIVVGDMEFDPELDKWVGNEEALSLFTSPQPALITNMGYPTKNTVVGKMRWDPKRNIWVGNEEELTKFEKRGPALISTISNAFVPKEINGMRFDSVAMRWVGNEDALSAFHDVAVDLSDDGFAVGNEFQISPGLIKSFMDCEQLHKSTLSGWWGQGNDQGTPDRLYSIRSLALLRVVHDLKQFRLASLAAAGEESEEDITVPEAENGDNIANDFSDEEQWDDVGDLSQSARLKLPEVKGMVEFDSELGDDNEQALPKRNDKRSDELEDWDNDFGGDVKLDQKLIKKSDSQVWKEESGRKMLAQSRDDDDDDEELAGIDFPPGPVLQLKKRNVVPNVDSDNEIGSPNIFATESAEDMCDEVEDWNDVDVPSHLGEPVTKKQNGNHKKIAVEEDWDNEFELPDKLTLKTPIFKSKDTAVGVGDEESWDDVDIPETFPARRS